MEQEREEAKPIDERLADSCDDVDMEGRAEVLERRQVYAGMIFTVEDMTLRMPAKDGGDGPLIRRQVLRHAPCVVMLVHDERNDRYLVEREYRVGSDRFAYGIPAGLLDAGESPEQAALRELSEETGVNPRSGAYRIDHVADCYSSEGMTDELAHIMVIHMDGWRQGPRHLDRDEHVASAWATWRELQELPITASNSVIAIQHERLRRFAAGLDVCHASTAN